jgi:hypothetical protein
MPVANCVDALIGQFLLMAVPRTKRSAGAPTLRSSGRFMVATTVCNFLIVTVSALDQTISAFWVPLIVALLAGPLLGEYVGWRRVLAIVARLHWHLDSHQTGSCKFIPLVDDRLRALHYDHARSAFDTRSLRYSIPCSWVSSAARFSHP